MGHGAWLRQGRGMVELMTFNCLGQAWGMVRWLGHGWGTKLKFWWHGWGMVGARLRHGLGM